MTENFEKQTTKTLTEIKNKLSEHDKHFKDYDEKLDRVFNRLLEHGGRFDQLENNITRKFDTFEDRILTAIDSIVKKNSDIDLEQLSTEVALDRLKDEIDLNKKEIVKIKKVVKIA